MKVRIVGMGGGGCGVEGEVGEERRALWVRNWVTREDWRAWAWEKGVMCGRWMWRMKVGADIE